MTPASLHTLRGSILFLSFPGRKASPANRVQWKGGHGNPESRTQGHGLMYSHKHGERISRINRRITGYENQGLMELDNELR
ncbi:hypothetical protein BDW66DRAFT_104764 [Aspergillus desertorum]